MKKVKFEGKLSLNKETIAKLNQAQMGHVKGGSHSCVVSCNPVTFACTATAQCSGCAC